MLKKIQIPVLALKDKKDYVPTPPQNIPKSIIEGGHVSPLQAKEEVLNFVQRVIDLEYNYQKYKHE